ncbi:MAG: hypothetical protein R2764_24695 [Bacteroidales bacterium]
MVRGKKFKEYFKDYSENYIIIGGTARCVIIDNAGFGRPELLKTSILIVEALSKAFVQKGNSSMMGAL